MGNKASSNVAVLGGVNVFCHLDESQLAQLAKLFTVETCKKSQIIYDVGHVVDHFYIIAEGSVEFIAPKRTLLTRTGRSATVGSSSKIRVRSSSGDSTGSGSAAGEAVLSASSAAAVSGLSHLYSKHTCDFFGELSLLSPDGAESDHRVQAGSDGCKVLKLSTVKFHASKHLELFVSLQAMLHRVSRERLIPTLRKIPFFAGLGNRTMKQLTSLLRYELFTAGRVICHEGDKGDSMMVVVDGTVQVSVSSGDTKQHSFSAEGFVVKQSPFVTKHWQQRYMVIENDRCSYYKIKLNDLEIDAFDAARIAAEAAAATGAGGRANLAAARGSVLVQQRRLRLGTSALPSRGTKRLATIPRRSLQLRGQFIMVDVRVADGEGYPVDIIGDDRTIRVRTGSMEARRLWVDFIRGGIKAAVLGQGVASRATVTSSRDKRRGKASGEIPGLGKSKSRSIDPSKERLNPRRREKRQGTVEDPRRRFSRRISVDARKRDIAPSSNAEQIILCELGPGSYFGEISLVTDMNRTATVASMDNVTALVLPRTFFQNFLAMLPPHVREEIQAMARQRTAATLQRLNLPFLAGFSERKLQILAQASRLERYNAGDVVFRQGDDGDRFYVVANGEVVIMVQNPGDFSEKEVNRLGQGGYFGEIALITDAPRLATVKASSAASLLSISKEDFINTFARESPAAMADFGLKLFRQQCELQHVLFHPEASQEFRRALESEFSAENFLFWEAASKFQDRFTREFAELREREESEAALVEPLPATGAGSALPTTSEDEVLSDESSAAAPPTGAMPRSNSSPDLHSSGVAGGRRGITKNRIDVNKDMARSAHAIYSEYIADDAAQQINIKSKIRARLDERLESNDLDPLLFHDAQDEIYKLMEKDNFARFKKSDKFKQLLDKVGAYSAASDDTDEAKATMRSRSSSHAVLVSRASVRLSRAALAAASIKGSGGAASSATAGPAVAASPPAPPT